MELVKKEEATLHSNSKACLIVNYPMKSGKISTVLAEIDGRYPEEGHAYNEEVVEMAYIVKGSGIVSIEGKVFELSEGDLVLIEPGEKFYWEGKMTLLIPTAPAWYPGQYRLVTEEISVAKD